MRGSLDWLLSPMTADAFFAAHFERRWLHLEGDPARLRGLPSLADIDRALTRRELRHPSVRMAREGTLLDASAFTRRSFAFDPHADNEDVFVLQLSGEKRWRLCQPDEAFPSLDPVSRGSLAVGEPVATPTLRATCSTFRAGILTPRRRAIATRCISPQGARPRNTATRSRRCEIARITRYALSCRLRGSGGLSMKVREEQKPTQRNDRTATARKSPLRVRTAVKAGAGGGFDWHEEFKGLYDWHEDF